MNLIPRRLASSVNFRSMSTNDKPAAADASPKTTVATIMTTDVSTVTPMMTVRDVIVLLTSKKISGAPVVNDMQVVISVVSEGDLLKLAASVGLEKQIGQCVDKLVKTKDLITARVSDSYADIYKKFLTKSVHRVIVTDDNGRLRGIVSRSNLLRTLVELAATPTA
ncbi:hypothetical protein BH10BDE1_BH10BDE1_30990 [soil metagenome]